MFHFLRGAHPSKYLYTKPNSLELETGAGGSGNGKENMKSAGMNYHFLTSELETDTLANSDCQFRFSRRRVLETGLRR